MTIIGAWKTYVVRCSGSEGWQGSHNKILEGGQNYECYVSKKVKETNVVFSYWNFSLVFFSVFPLCHYFLFALLTIIRTTKGQRTHINEAPNINKIIYYNYDIMAKSRCEAILNIPKNYFILSYLGVTLSTCNVRDSFFLT